MTVYVDDAFVEGDWGHRHGQRLAYGDDKIDTMPTPAKLRARSE